MLFALYIHDCRVPVYTYLCELAPYIVSELKIDDYDECDEQNIAVLAGFVFFLKLPTEKCDVAK